MRSNCLLICDDDIIPGKNFISFFYANHEKNPEDILCVRGHSFLPHVLNNQDPHKVWMEYDNLRFRNDEEPEQFIHFVHADACLIPRNALLEIASEPIPDPTFALVDDYWMSYILYHKFGRRLRKLSISGLKSIPIVRTDDSDEVGLALHTRPEVYDARLRLYVHHMQNGWPKWETPVEMLEIREAVREKKMGFWNSSPQIGFNVSSAISTEDVAYLRKTGAKLARIGAVGVGGNEYFELSGFLKDPKTQLSKLENTVRKLGNIGVDVVITLDRRLASEKIWEMIAETFCTFANVVGYDLINEPYTKHENSLHWADLANDSNDNDLADLENKLHSIIKSIRAYDPNTAIILEPTFWGRIHGLAKFPIEKFLKTDPNLVFSIHFYEPMVLTTRVRNRNRYSFPCHVPWYDGAKFSEETYWNEKTVLEKLKSAKVWADEKGVRIFIAEFGICRDVGGAGEYLKAVMSSCKGLSMTSIVFSFRDGDWEAMDYEFGHDIHSYQRQEDSNLMKIILDGIASMNN